MRITHVVKAITKRSGPDLTPCVYFLGFATPEEVEREVLPHLPAFDTAFWRLRAHQAIADARVTRRHTSGPAAEIQVAFAKDGVDAFVYLHDKLDPNGERTPFEATVATREEAQRLL